MFVSAFAGGDEGKFSLVWLTGLKVILMMGHKLTIIVVVKGGR